MAPVNRPPGPCLDCWQCAFWKPGPHGVVVRGSTMGWCETMEATVPADFWCDCWKRGVPVMDAAG